MENFNELFESQLSKSIKMTKKADKDKDKERKDDDRRKVKADDEERKNKKDSEVKPKAGKANVPGEGELMAKEIGAQAELDTADAGEADADAAEIEGGDEKDPKDKKDKKDDKKDKKKGKNPFAKNEDFYTKFQTALN